MDIKKVDPFTNVVATGKATATWKPDRPCSLFGFLLELGGTTFTQGTHITGMTVKHGSKRLFPGITGARHMDLYEYEGVISDAAYVFMGFGDPTARTFKGQHLGNLDHTVYPGNTTLEIDIAGATAPTLNAYALIMPPKLDMGGVFQPHEAQLHRALIETVIQFSAAVASKAVDISMGSEAGAVLKKLAFFHANITVLGVKKSGFDIYEDIPIALSASLQDDVFVRLPQAGLTVYDPIVSGDYSEVKTTVDANGNPFNYQVRLTTSGADTITAYADVLTKIPLL